MGICQCKSPERFEQIGSWDGCPLKGGGHTSFFVERCLDCGKITGFPRSNFDKALEKGTIETKAKLSQIVAENEIYPEVEIGERT
jgi:hypothetical protein